MSSRHVGRVSRVSSLNTTLEICLQRVRDSTGLRGRKSRGWERVTQNFKVGSLVQIVPRFCRILEFQAPYIACIAMGGKGTDKKYRSEFTRARHFNRKIHFFPGKGLSRSPDPSPGGRGVAGMVHSTCR